MGDWKMVVKKGFLTSTIWQKTSTKTTTWLPSIRLVNQMKQVILREHRPNDLFPVTLPK